MPRIVIDYQLIPLEALGCLKQSPYHQKAIKMIQTILSSTEVTVEPKLLPVVNIVETVDSANSCSSADEHGETANTINDLLLERLKRIPDEPLVGYPASTRGASDYVYYTARDLDRFTGGAVKAFVEQGLPIHVGSTKSMSRAVH